MRLGEDRDPIGDARHAYPQRVRILLKPGVFLPWLFQHALARSGEAGS